MQTRLLFLSVISAADVTSKSHPPPSRPAPQLPVRLTTALRRSAGIAVRVSASRAEHIRSYHRGGLR